jgi:hypothetical protein
MLQLLPLVPESDAESTLLIRILLRITPLLHLARIINRCKYTRKPASSAYVC